MYPRPRPRPPPYPSKPLQLSNKYSLRQRIKACQNPHSIQFAFVDTPTFYPRRPGEPTAKDLILRRPGLMLKILTYFCHYTQNDMQALLNCLTMNRQVYVTMKSSVVLQNALFRGDGVVTGDAGETLLNPMVFESENPNKSIVLVREKAYKLTEKAAKVLGIKGTLKFHGLVDGDGDEEMEDGDEQSVSVQRVIVDREPAVGQQDEESQEFYFSAGENFGALRRRLGEMRRAHEAEKHPEKSTEAENPSEVVQAAGALLMMRSSR